MSLDPDHQSYLHIPCWPDEEALPTVALSTPTNPLELAPFSFHSVLDRVFDSPHPTTSTTSPTSPTSREPDNRPLSPTSARSVLGSFVNSVAQTVVAQTTAGDANPSSGGPTKRQTIRTDQVNALELVDELSPTLSKKPIDKINLLGRLDNKAIILSEGILTFHSLPTLEPLNVHQFPSVRGVVTFSLDEDDGSTQKGSSRDPRMQLVAIKRRSIHWCSISNEGITTIKDLPLPDGANLSVLRRKRLCIADSENYSIVDLEAAEAWPLLPVSQAPNPEPFHSTLSVAGGATSEGNEGTTTPPPPPDAPDPRQRPAIACVGTNEFLVASHTAGTTLGVFVNENGEPCRGTLEWASNLRSLVVDQQYSIALLWNNTIEIHSLLTQEIVQVVTLPQDNVGIKTLIRAHQDGIEVSHATGASKVELVQIPLSQNSASNAKEPPTTPPSKRRDPDRRSRVTPSKTQTTKLKTTRILVIARNSLYALTPLTLVVQADALLDKGRVEDCLQLVQQVEQASIASRESPQDIELAYIYLRLAYLNLVETRFDRGFEFFLKSRCDPRIVIKLFLGLLSGSEREQGVEDLIGKDDLVEVARGVRTQVENGKTIEQYITDHLESSDDPSSSHPPSDTDTTTATVDRSTELLDHAKDSLLSYLMKWRIQRREGEGSRAEGGISGRRTNDSRKVDMVVDTTLVSLLATANRPQDIKVLLAAPNDCVLPLIEQDLIDAGLYQLVAELALKKGRTERVLEIWTKILDGDYVDPTFQDGTRQVFDLVSRSKDKSLVEKYGLWLVQRDRLLGLRIFNDPKQTLRFDTRELFARMRQVDVDGADLFLEGAVLQERDTDSDLHVDLVNRYLGKLGELLADPEAKAHLRKQETSYLELEASTLSPPTFLSFLTTRYSSESRFALLDRVRLKAILFLSHSTKYDVSDAKRELEDLEVKGARGLTLERTIVYGKLKLDRQALALLLHTLQDLSSAETYALQNGDPLVPTEVAIAASKLKLALKRTRRNQHSAAVREEGVGRQQWLARMLVEMCLAQASEVRLERIAKILDTQSMSLDTAEILTTIPDSFPLELVAPFVSRSVRRSLHTHHESSILKNLASGQNLAISERLFEVHHKFGPTVDPEQSQGKGSRFDKSEKRSGSSEKAEDGAHAGTRGNVEEKEVSVVRPEMLHTSLEDTIELDLR
ncbi:uncharacterized protein JCM15063_001342 [Sporobolomyces koalae]|uniref:uncharacterized protein n=1 Tax=Sporobolomyces koalae TaxID=500713 RepID=UPI00316D93FF